MRNHRVQHPALVTTGELLELVTRTSRVLEVAHGKHDLDVARKQPEAVEQLRSARFRPADRCHRRPGTPLREPQLREPGLRLPTVLARLLVRCFRGRELSL